MNEETRDPPWWKRLLEWLHKHTKDTIGLGIVAVLLWPLKRCWDKGSPLLFESIQKHPARTVCLAALGTTIFSVWNWMLWKRIANIALEKASKVDDLEVAIALEREKYSRLQAKSKPDDILKQPHERHAVACILGAGEITAVELTAEIKIAPHVAMTTIRDLIYDTQLIYRVGTKNGVDVLGITELGRAYAASHGIAPIEQSIKQIRESAAEERIKTLTADLQQAHKERAEYAIENERLKHPQPAFHPVSGSAGTNPPH